MVKEAHDILDFPVPEKKPASYRLLVGIGLMLFLATIYFRLMDWPYLLTCFLSIMSFLLFSILRWHRMRKQSFGLNLFFLSIATLFMGMGIRVILPDDGFYFILAGLLLLPVGLVTLMAEQHKKTGMDRFNPGKSS